MTNGDTNGLQTAYPFPKGVEFPKSIDWSWSKNLKLRALLTNCDLKGPSSDLDQYNQQTSDVKTN